MTATGQLNCSGGRHHGRPRSESRPLPSVVCGQVIQCLQEPAGTAALAQNIHGNVSTTPGSGLVPAHLMTPVFRSSPILISVWCDVRPVYTLLCKQRQTPTGGEGGAMALMSSRHGQFFIQSERAIGPSGRRAPKSGGISPSRRPAPGLHRSSVQPHREP